MSRFWGVLYFRLATSKDMQVAAKATKALDQLQRKHRGTISLFPDEPLPPDGALGFRVQKYGMQTWGDLFTPRQTLALVTFYRLVREVYQRLLRETKDNAFARAVTTCLALVVSNASHYFASLSYYHPFYGMRSSFGGNGFPMKADFAEGNLMIPRLVGGIEYPFEQLNRVIEREMTNIKRSGTVQQGSATRLPLPNDSVQYIVTDPPYYDAVPYADLSDFCYVWLKRMLGDLYPDLFRWQLTPKAEECIMDPGPPRQGEPEKTWDFFEDTIQKALAECNRVLQPEGIAVVLFAHKGTAGWEALLNALVQAGWTVTASWPIDTERGARMRAKGSAVLASSVHLVCRPRLQNAGVGDWRQVLSELQPRIHEWMPRLSKEGVVGADAIFSCLGPALEIFSRYERVETAGGKKIELKEYLEHVWAAVAREALNMIFAGADASGFEEDSRLTALWLWTLHSSVNNISAKTNNKHLIDEETEEEPTSKKTLQGFYLEYDAVRKIAQGLGAHLEVLGGPGGIVEIKGDKARLISVGERWKTLFGKEIRPRQKKKSVQATLFEMPDEVKEEEVLPSKGKTVLDRLHQAMLLFADGRSSALRRFIVDEGIGNDDRFWRLADVLNYLYPRNSNEWRWVNGVLGKKKSFGF